VPAAVGLVVAAPELRDDLERLVEHLEPLVGPRPARAGDVLVQRLAAADAEEEPSFHQERGGGSRLSDDRRVDADQRAGDGRAQPETLRPLRDRADHAPDERAVSLRIHPRVEVIGDEDVREARVLGAARVLDELRRRVLLGGQPVADLHDVPVPRRRGLKPV
jgi:hypothetical protein